MDELISIIVPVYNAEKYLDSCLNSILCQEYKMFEIILVDDGSKDNSGKICDKYAKKDDRIRVFHKDNEGVSAARTYGMKQIRGKYFMFVDSDDELASNALRQIQEHFKYEADVMIFGCMCVKGSVKNQNVPEDGFYTRKEFAETYMSLYEKFLINSPWNKVYRTELLNADTCFPMEMSLGEDLIFCNSYLCRCTSYMVMNLPLYIYKMRESDSLSTKYYDGLFDLYYLHFQDIVNTISFMDPTWNRNQCDLLYEMYRKYIKHSINMLVNKENKATLNEKYREIRRICRHSFTCECVDHVQCEGIYDVFLKRKFPLGIFLYLICSKIKKRFYGK